ncbi:hypothetical protein AAIP55_002219 [Flavobacterium psychrophilum]|nr:hypothetical protein [Flavobacterium psychrophilum]
MKSVVDELKQEIVDRVCKYLCITNDEYSEMVFEFGIKYCEVSSVFTCEATKTKSYWRLIRSLFEKHNLDLDKALPKDKSLFKIEDRKGVYLNILFNGYNISWFLIEEINQELKELSLNPKTIQRPTRAPKSKNNPLEINLNTI